MSKLSEMHNIGAILERKLIEVGINDQEELRNIGSKKAFVMIKSMDDTACLNMLCALEGAIQGIRWHYLSDSDKNDLKNYFDTLSK